MPEFEQYIVSLRVPITGVETPSDVSSLSSISSSIPAGAQTNTHNSSEQTLVGLWPHIAEHLISGPSIVFDKAINLVAVSAIGIVLSYSNGQRLPTQLPDIYISSTRRRRMRRRIHRVFDPAEIPAPAVLINERKRIFAAHPPRTENFLSEGELRMAIQQKISDGGKR